MKKITAIFFLPLFLIANLGVAVSVHWCGGKLDSIDFFSDGKHKCKCGEKAMKLDCCKDKTVQLRASDELAKTKIFNSLGEKIYSAQATSNLKLQALQMAFTSFK